MNTKPNKQTSNYFFLLLITSVFFYSCGLIPKQRTGPHELIAIAIDTANFHKQYGNDKQVTITTLYEQISGVINSRLKKIGVDEDLLEITTKNNLLIVKIWGLEEQDISRERIRHILQVKGKISFWETYSLKELASTLALANKRLTEADMDSLNRASGEVRDSGNSIHNLISNKGPLFNILAERFDNETNQLVRNDYAEMGTAKPEDTGKVRLYLSDPRIKILFPYNTKFLWMPSKKENKTMYKLVALRASTHDEQAALKGDIITDARMKFENGEANPIISVTMTPVAGTIWARITKANIGRCIAIDIDGMVFSAPVVQNEISGGRSSITGNFDIHEAKDMAAVLGSGSMPAPIKIVEEKTEN